MEYATTNNENDPLQQIPLEIDSTKHFLIQRNVKISNMVKRLNQMMKEIQNRNKTLSSYANNLVQVKNHTETEKIIFENDIQIKMSQIDNDYSNLNSIFEQFCKKSQNNQQEIQSRQNVKKRYVQGIDKCDQTIKFLDAKLNSDFIIPKKQSKFNCHRLKQQLEQLSIIYTETESHCIQYNEYINSLNKDYNFYKMSKQLMIQRELQLNQQIASEQSSFDKQKLALIQEKRNQRKMQMEYMKQHEKLLKLTKSNQIDTIKNQNSQKMIMKNSAEVQNDLSEDFISSNPQFDRNRMFYIIDEIEKIKSIKNQAIDTIKESKIDLNNKYEMIHELTQKLECDNDSMSIEFPYLTSIIEHLECFQDNLTNEVNIWRNISSSKIIDVLKAWDQILNSYVS